LAIALFGPRLHPCERVFSEGGERYLDMAVTGAAGLEDRYEARTIDPDMIPEQALTRLREPG
jgi:hypothetical protein